ncbi:FecCD family ABC transporter permease [Thauera sp. Sel9]|uniref:FecCD family ABC transporter permease n=1 Tax=Thauera sp. Sel9 TaxID=2974299 RepID=UPI0021E104CC|nr:iron ABC transporter permease [Thauera sp. Sel9]MCV2219369.1 iron ABC transporter permease [Thauera sp. Sel9]
MNRLSARPVPYPLRLSLLAACTLALAVGTLLKGTLSFTPAQLYELLHAAMHGDPSGVLDSPSARILLGLRIPRMLLAFLVGAGLAVAGAVLQAGTRNQLADPYLFGLSAGATLGVVGLITLAGASVGTTSIALAAFCGATLALLLVAGSAFPRRGEAPERLVLAGVAVAFLLSAASNFLIYWGGREVAQSALFWALGSLGGARWPMLALPAAVVAAGFLYCLYHGRQLDALTMGEESATTLGIDVRRTRLALLLVATLMTAVLVSQAGAIGFVGLVVPHLARYLAGGAHLRLLPACALLGGALLIAADWLARVIVAPSDLPVGIITAGIGGIYFLLMLHSQRR